MSRKKQSDVWDGSIVCGTELAEVIASKSRKREFDPGVLHALIAEHVKLSHPHSGTMATTWNVCDGCNVFLTLLDEIEHRA